MAVQLYRSFLLIADIHIALFSVIQEDPKPLSSLLKHGQLRGGTKSPFLQWHSCTVEVWDRVWRPFL